MAFQLQILWVISAIAFFFAGAMSLRNYFLAKKVSNLWLWLSIAMALIGLSRLANFLVTANPLWTDASIALLLVGAVVIIVVMFDFEKDVNICVNCEATLSNLPAKEQVRKATRLLKGF